MVMGGGGEIGSRFRSVNSFCVLLLVMVVLVSLQPSSCSTLNTEGKALLRFHDRVLKDPFGALSNWNGDGGGGINPCSWFGVGCAHGRVAVLDLRDLCLEGALGPELRKLTHLKSIILRNNSFSGEVPEEIGELKELEILDLRYNNFSGRFPSAIVNNLSLTNLLLGNNDFLKTASPRIHELKRLSENLLVNSFPESPSKSLSVSRNDARYGSLSYRRLLQQQVEAPTPSSSSENRRKKQTTESSPSSASSISPSPSPSLSISPSISEPPESSVSPSSSQLLPKSHSTSPSPSPSPILAPRPTPKVKSHATSPVSPSSQPRETKQVPSPTLVSTPRTNLRTDNNPKQKHWVLIICAGVIGGSLIVLFSAVGFVYFRDSKVVTVKPLATGLSGQLQKAFVTGSNFGSRNLNNRKYGRELELPPSFTVWHIYRTNFIFQSFHSGAKCHLYFHQIDLLLVPIRELFVSGVPKLNRSELEAACEDFSNVIGNLSDGMVYKGTLSSGVEIAVTSTAVTSSEDWSKNLESQFRNKIDVLSKLNHKNFVNLIGYCEEEKPFTRMMVFEYAPNGSLFEHLHIKESELLDWQMRLRIAMGIAYCLEYMHELSPPIAHRNLNSSSICLTEDYAAKVSDFSLWNDLIATNIRIRSHAVELLDVPLADPKSNIYSFGLILFEMITGRIPYSMGNGFVLQSVSTYLKGQQSSKEMVDPTLSSYQEDVVLKLFEVIEECIDPEPNRRPEMREITERLKKITAMEPEAATPKLSPLWWAELEIMSTGSSHEDVTKV